MSKLEDVEVRRREVERGTFPGQKVTDVEVEILAPGLPPYTIWIPKQDWTPDLEVERVRQALKRLRERKTETIKV